MLLRLLRLWLQTPCNATSCCPLRLHDEPSRQTPPWHNLFATVSKYTSKFKAAERHCENTVQSTDYRGWAWKWIKDESLASLFVAVFRSSMKFKVRKWHVHANCFRHDQQRTEKLGRQLLTNQLVTKSVKIFPSPLSACFFSVFYCVLLPFGVINDDDNTCAAYAPYLNLPYLLGGEALTPAQRWGHISSAQCASPNVTIRLQVAAIKP